MTGLGALRGRLGHFVRAAAAAPAEPVAVEEQDEDDLVLPSENPRQQTQRLGAELSAVLAELAAAREQRQSLLGAGDVAAVEVIDYQIRRLTIAFESLQARVEESYFAALQFDEDQRQQEWAQLRPRLEAARRQRNRAAYELMVAIAAAASLEGEARALGVELTDQTPAEPPYTRYLFDRWTGDHLARAVEAA